MIDIDKSLLLDSEGRPFTQGLFLEATYSENAIYTFKDRIHEYKGKLHYPIRQYYLEMMDVTEYEFANKYFLGWDHWKRCCENKLILPHVNAWREELELKIRLIGIKSAIKSAQHGGFQAAKWLVDKGWIDRNVGRPSKADMARDKKFQERVDAEYSADIIRLQKA